MKKILISILIATIGLSVLSVGVLAAPESRESTTVGPYEGTFYGMVSGDKESRAPIALKLTHQGDTVEGYVYLGEGLYVDGGVCGAANVPSGLQFASGQTASKNPDRLSALSKFDVGGFDVSVELISEISTDGDTVTAEAQIDLPWICGHDPVLRGTLERIQ